jgi:hypothetical protein
MTIPEDGRNKVFVSYSHNDIEWLKRLQIHLKDLERRGLIELWDDTKIRTGAQWRKEISEALSAARIAILLVSADFIASDFIAEDELPPLLAAAEKEGVTILPLILSPSRFQQIESLARFQSVNPPSKPLIGLPRVEQEQYLVKLGDDILRAVKEPLTTNNHLRTEAFTIQGKAREPAIDPIVQAADLTSRRAFIGAIVAAMITIVGGIIVAFINGWFTRGTQRATPDAGIYRVRVTVLDTQGKPTDDADVTSAFGGEIKKVKGGWQIDIPTVSKPKDGKWTVIATKESAFLRGEETFTLDNEMNPAVIVKMLPLPPAKVRGQVVDSKNRAVAGARVFVVGYESEAVITKEGGNFELPAHAAVDQQVLLHAQKNGHPAVKLWHPAGDAPAVLSLER